MMRKLPTLLTCLALAPGLAIAGCGDDEEPPAGGGTKTETPEAVSGDTVTVSMKDVLFTPENVTVKVGQTVKWVNDDPIDHTATAKSGSDFDSGNVKAGGTFEWEADKAGKVDYVCTIHPSQKGTITVE